MCIREKLTFSLDLLKVQARGGSEAVTRITLDNLEDYSPQIAIILDHLCQYGAYDQVIRILDALEGDYYHDSDYRTLVEDLRFKKAEVTLDNINQYSLKKLTTTIQQLSQKLYSDAFYIYEALEEKVELISRGLYIDSDLSNPNQAVCDFQDRVVSLINDEGADEVVKLTLEDMYELNLDDIAIIIDQIRGEGTYMQEDPILVALEDKLKIIKSYFL